MAYHCLWIFAYHCLHPIRNYALDENLTESKFFCNLLYCFEFIAFSTLFCSQSSKHEYVCKQKLDFALWMDLLWPQERKVRAKLVASLCALLDCHMTCIHWSSQSLEWKDYIAFIYLNILSLIMYYVGTSFQYVDICVVFQICVQNIIQVFWLIDFTTQVHSNPHFKTQY